MTNQERIAAEAPETAWFRQREDEAARQLAEFFAMGTTSLAEETKKDLGLAELDDKISRELEAIFSPAPSVASGLERELSH
ncbi:MAG: hypothetical protein PUD81_06890 [Eggerthellales bacterium]|nr:hypothetical protein [Eggerthellales bacterium]